MTHSLTYHDFSTVYAINMNQPFLMWRNPALRQYATLYVSVSVLIWYEKQFFAASELADHVDHVNNPRVTDGQRACAILVLPATFLVLEGWTIPRKQSVNIWIKTSPLTTASNSSIDLIILPLSIFQCVKLRPLKQTEWPKVSWHGLFRRIFRTIS